MKKKFCRFLTRLFLFLNVQFQIQIFRVIYPLSNFQVILKEIIIQSYFQGKLIEWVDIRARLLILFQLYEL